MKVIDEERIIGFIAKNKREKNRTDDDIAHICGISRVTLQKRKANGRWYGKELAALADEFGCSMDEFTKEVEEG